MPKPDAFSIDLESFLDAVPEMIVYHDDKLNVIWAKHAASEFSGFHKEKWIGRKN